MAGVVSFISCNPISQSLLKLNSKRPKFSYAPMAVNMSSNATTTTSYWTSVNGDIDAYLKQSIPMKPPFVVFEPMHQLTFSTPPTTAPALCIAACELVGGHQDQAMAAASALRLMHVASYIHEHISSSDSYEVKARPKVHYEIGSNIKLLTGDGLVPFGLELLAKTAGSTQNSEPVIRAIVEITRAHGSQGMIYGQFNKLLHVEYDYEKLSNINWIEDVYKNKEGRIHACAAACGAILGGGNEDEIERLRRFGLYVGILQGIFNWDGGSKGKSSMLEKVNELRSLAVEELKGFDKAKVESIWGLVEADVW